MTGVLNRLHPGLAKKPPRTEDDGAKPIRWVLASLCHPADGIEIVLTGDPPRPRIVCANCGATMAEIGIQPNRISPDLWPLPRGVKAKLYSSTVRPIDRLLAARALAAAQKDDPALWLGPAGEDKAYVREAVYLREALRRIHAALEGDRLPWPPLPGEKP